MDFEHELQALGESFAELIMEDERAQNWVDTYAQYCLDSFMATLTKECQDSMMPAVREEMLCQYQVAAWHKLFNRVGL